MSRRPGDSIARFTDKESRMKGWPGHEIGNRPHISKLQSTLERKLLLAGFLEVQALEDTQSLAITGKKASRKAGSSFALKKAMKTIPKLQIDDNSELIDGDSLLTEDDLKKPQLPLVGDCEVGSSKIACSLLATVVGLVMPSGAVDVPTKVSPHSSWVRRLLYLGISLRLISESKHRGCVKV